MKKTMKHKSSRKADSLIFSHPMHPPKISHRLFAITATKARAQSDGFGLAVRRQRTLSPSGRTTENNVENLLTMNENSSSMILVLRTIFE